MAIDIEVFRGMNDEQRLASLASLTEDELAQLERELEATGSEDRRPITPRTASEASGQDANDSQRAAKEGERVSSSNPDRREGTPPSPSDSNQQSQIAQPEIPRTRADASRENGSKSRGPITQQGKDISRYGALAHGLTSKTVLGRPDELERFHHFTIGLKNDLLPKGVLEITLVESLATAQWQFDRCRANEMNLQFEAATKFMEECPEGHDEKIHWARAQAKAMEEKAKQLDLFGRYGARHHRQMLQILDCFQKTKKLRIEGEYAEIRENKKNHNQALAKHQQAAATGSEPRPTGRGPSNQSNQPAKPAPGFVCPDSDPPSSKEPRA